MKNKIKVYSASHIDYLLERNDDIYVVKITTLAGTAAWEIPNVRTIQSQACLNIRNITPGFTETWK